MPEQVGNPLDPFGQFLAQAFLSGRVPGNQTSAYNTVLDLLSPGAMTDRAEAGAIDPANLFFNQFGVVPQQDELLQMMQQRTGLTTTPAQNLEAETARFTAEQETEGRRLYGEAASEATAEVAKIREESEADFREEQKSWLGKLAESRIGLEGAQAKLFGAQAGAEGQAAALSPKDRADLFALTISAHAAGYKEVDAQGKESGKATPQEQEIALKLKGLNNDKLLSAIAPLINAGEMPLAFEIIDSVKPGEFSLENLEGYWGRLVSSWAPGGLTGKERVKRAPPGGAASVFGLGGGQPAPVDPNRPQSNIGGPAMNETQLSNVLTNIDAMLAMGQIDPVQAEGMKQEIMDAYKSKGALQ